MIDIAHYPHPEKKVGRCHRGAAAPAEVKYAKKSWKPCPQSDLSALDAEFQRSRAHGKGKTRRGGRQRGLLPLYPRHLNQLDTFLRFEFLASPVRILGDWFNGISALKVEDNTLAISDGNFKAVGRASRARSECGYCHFWDWR